MWNQSQFNQWAESRSGPTHAGLAILMVFGIAAISFAFAVLGPKLVREGNLLWFGVSTTGNVTSAAITESGKFKGGDPKYTLDLVYAFQTPDGAKHSGTTRRTDLSIRPLLVPGDAIGVRYSKDDPSDSVADYNLAIDVYALVFFLPFLAAVGFGTPGWYLWRLWRWRRERHRAA